MGSISTDVIVILHNMSEIYQLLVYGFVCECKNDVGEERKKQYMKIGRSWKPNIHFLQESDIFLKIETCI